MNFDIEIVVPVSGHGKYLKRFESFKKFGLQNIHESTKVLLTLLVGNENLPDAVKDWPEFLTVRIIDSNVNHCAAKVYDYYHRMPELNQNINVKWHMRIDDDSFTNVYNLVKRLEELNPIDECYYFVGGTTEGDVSVDLRVVTKLGIQVHLPIIHEVECCILSEKLMSKIYSNEDARKIIFERSKIEAGYTDISLCICAQIIGIYPTVVPFLTQHANVYEYLMGLKHHIHYVAPDICEIKYNFITKLRENSNVKFCGEDMIFGVRVNDTIEFACHRILQSDGFCLPLRERLLWFYDQHVGKLILLNQDCKIIDEYFIPNEKYVKYTEGKCSNQAKVPFVRSLHD